MSRSGGYKCYNIQCGSCIGKTLCGEPGEDALSCADRIVPRKTNADLLARAEAAEARAEKAERQRDEYFKHLQGLCFCCAHRTDGFDCHVKCYGHKRGSAWVYAGPEKEE